MFELIILIAGICLIVFVNGTEGAVLSAIALLVSIFQLQSKSKLTYVTFVLSIIVLGIYTYVTFILGENITEYLRLL